MSLFPQLRSRGEQERWDPFNGATALLDAFSDVFNNKWHTTAEMQWSPALDVIENDKEILLKMDAPGLESKDIHVEIDNGDLLIYGERKYESEHKEDNYLRIERRFGKFSRSFNLPDYVDQEHIKAECKNGMLKVHLAKKPGKKKEVKAITVHD